MPVSYEVARTINAGPDRVWRLLRNAEGYSCWTMPDMNEAFGQLADGLKAAAAEAGAS